MNNQKRRVYFLPRAGMIQYLNSDEHHEDNVVISISDTLSEKNAMIDRLEETDASYVAVHFADSDSDDGMSACHANEILQFINKHKDKTFIVHCWAGISRSGAVAKFINEYFQLEYSELAQYTSHNRRVFNKMHAAAGTSIAAFYAELERNDRSYDP